jgi:hypothetical protein
MKATVSETQTTTELSRHRAFLWAFLRFVGSSSLLLLLLFISSTVSSSALSFLPSTAAHAASRQVADISSYADIAIVVDNINKIKSHDPAGVRFSAAQIFVDQAQPGDRIGVVRIPSSDKPAPVKLLDLTAIHNGNDRNAVKQVLTQSFFGPVDPGPTAYFAPAFQTASQMLLSAQDSNRKYIIVVTDSIAQSGDQEPCSSASDQYHQWFCEIPKLESNNISVILLGFTTPGSETELQPTRQYLQEHGGIVLQVEDGAGLAEVAQKYTDILARIHPNVFYASLNSVPGALTIGSQDQLSSLTFVVLGGSGVNPSLSSLIAPGGNNVANQNTGDGVFYTASTSNYWLESIRNGELAGSWHFTATSGSLQMLVIGVSEAHFVLLDPAPASNSDISVRYVPPNLPVALHAQITGTGGEPLTGVLFTADPAGQNQPFTATTLPLTSIQGSLASDVSAILSSSAATGGTAGALSVGIGSPVVPGVYLVKQYQIKANSELSNKAVQVNVSPPSSSLPGATVSVQAQGTASQDIQSLSIFEKDSASASGWTQVGKSSTGTTAIQGTFPILHGCGDTYDIVAVEEISGSLVTGQYGYLAYNQISYISHLQQAIFGTATLASDKYLAPWPLTSQITWDVALNSTFCTPQDMQLKIPTQSGTPSFALNSGGGTFTVADNTATSRTVSLTVSNCPLSLFSDQHVSLQLVPVGNFSASSAFIKQGDWQTTVTCPSAISYGWRHPLQAIIFLFILSVILVRLAQLPLLPVLPGTHLTGEVEVVTKAAVLTGENMPDLDAYAPISVHIPKSQYSAIWYLVRRLEGGDTVYRFERQESPLALLRFKAERDASGYHVMVAATRYATGPNLPELRWTGLPIGQELMPYEGEPIVVAQDLLSPKLNVVP